MFDEWDLRDRTALVTGGSRGIGRALVAALLEAEMQVIATGRHGAHLDQLAAGMDSPEQLTVCVCDQRDPADVADLFALARDRFDKLDLLVNNAGIGVFAPVEETGVDDWDTVMEVNARGCFLCARAAFAWMRETGGGRIINIGSVVSHKGYLNQAAYAASKHAVLGLTKVLAREGQALGIRVSAVCPGGVDTQMAGQARPDLDRAGLIRPEDVARAVLYLAREPASCVTDQLNLRRPGSTPFA